MKVEKIVENKDGSARMTYSLNPCDEAKFKAMAKKEKRRYSHAYVNSVILKVLQAACDLGKTKVKPKTKSKVKRKVSKK